jgi:hypothetical protein
MPHPRGMRKQRSARGGGEIEQLITLPRNERS